MFLNPTYSREGDLNECIRTRFDKVIKQSKIIKDMTAATKNNSQLPYNFYKTYRSIFPKDNKPYNVNDFKTIGFVNPYPFEDAGVSKINNLKEDDEGNVLDVYS